MIGQQRVWFPVPGGVYPAIRGPLFLVFRRVVVVYIYQIGRFFSNRVSNVNDESK